MKFLSSTIKTVVNLVLGMSLLFATAASAAMVNVNQDSAKTLSAELNGVGMVKAQRIVNWCQQHRCSKAEDLLEVKGIGPKTIEKNRDSLSFSKAKKP